MDINTLPFSSSLKSNGLLFLSGKVGLDHGILVQGFKAQFRQAMFQVKQELVKHGLNIDDVISVRVYLTDLPNHYVLLNESYAQYFQEHSTRADLPVRTTVGVAALPLGALIELEVIASFNK